MSQMCHKKAALRVDDLINIDLALDLGLLRLLQLMPCEESHF